MSLTCPKCHTENPIQSSFCNKCGSQILNSEGKPIHTQTIELPGQVLEQGSILGGQYEIISELGRGGMGVVYRAKDTKLEREVALKLLPEALAQDRERLARFEREAKLLASLNHPSIAAIYGFEKDGERHFLVLELVDGETLDEKIRSRSLEGDDVLKIAIKITEALEAAHKKGIIHRDLKPANIKVTKEGEVKVLDFGLAKAFEAAPTTEDQESDLAKSPTITAGSSHSGVILGTAAYMSPEQARGKPLDKRTDIWSFGCVLFELIAGRQPFKGDTISDYIAAILKNEPAWEALSANSPRKLNDLLRRCLRKDPHNRLHDIADARIEIQDILTGPVEETIPEAPSQAKWRNMFWALTGFVFILTCLFLWSPWRTTSPLERSVSRFKIDLSPGETIASDAGAAAVLSPDGTQLVYAAQKEDTPQLYLRPIHEFESQPIPGTEGGNGPFFSPDGHWVAFYADGMLKKVSLRGGAPQVICEAKSGLSGDWSENDIIYFGDWSISSIMQVPASGGTAERLTTALRGGEGRFEHSHFWPQILPGGRALLFTIMHTPEDLSVAVYFVETRELKIIVEKGTYGRYLNSGYLIYAWSGDLMAVPFDLNKMEAVGSPVPVFNGIEMGDFGVAHFSLSENGSLGFVPGAMADINSRIVWVDLAGNVEELPFPSRFYQSPRLSPDGKQLVVARLETVSSLWIYGLERGDSRRLTDEKGSEFWAIWTLDGKSLVFNSTRTGRNQVPLLLKPVDGNQPEEPFTESEFHLQPKSWSADGKWMVMTEGLNPETGLDILMLNLEGDHKPEPFLNSRFNECHPIFSPTGPWLAYTSDESGRDEIYVCPFPGPGKIIPISTEGGREPVWSPDGKSLYYRDISGSRMMGVSFVTEPELIVGRPRIVFEGKFFAGSIWGRNYDISPNGDRFLMIKEEEQKQRATQIRVILNWSEELKNLFSQDRN